MNGRESRDSVYLKTFMKRQAGKSLKKIQAVLQDRDIPLEDCRGQCYDNGANMSGKVKGVQAFKRF